MLGFGTVGKGFAEIVKKKANLPPKKKGGPPGRKSVQEDSEVRCFFVVLCAQCRGLWCLVVVLVARQGFTF